MGYSPRKKYVLPQPSAYQEVGLDLVCEGENTIWNNVAGSGKSTMGLTIVQRTCELHPDWRILLVCFQRNVRQEFQNRAGDVFSDNILTRNLTIQTSYSIGLELLKSKYGHRDINATRINYQMAGKLRRLYNKYGENKSLDMFGLPFEEIKRPMMAWYNLSALRVVGKYQDMMDIEQERQLFDEEPHELLAEIVWDMLEYADKTVVEGEKVWNAKLRQEEIKMQIDYTDMVAHVARHHEEMRGKVVYNQIIVDEAQDTSIAQLETIKCLANAYTQWVFLGDRKQSIMQFAGARLSTVDILKNQFDCQEVRVPVSYRIPTKVRDEARKFVPDLECPEGTKEGFVGYIRYKKALEKLEAGDLIIARTIGQLLEFSILAVSNGVPVNFRGADIRAILMDSLNAIKIGYGFRDFDKSVNDYVNDKVSHIRERDGDNADEDKILDLKRLGKALIALYEHANANGFRGSDAFEEFVKGLFAKEAEDETITLADRVVSLTIHQSKGGEADTVWLLMPPGGFPYRTDDMTESQMVEEDNIAYVAITRAKRALWYVIPDNDTTISEPMMTITEQATLIPEKKFVPIEEALANNPMFPMIDLGDSYMQALADAMHVSTRLGTHEYRSFKGWFRNAYQEHYGSDEEAQRQLDIFFKA